MGYYIWWAPSALNFGVAFFNHSLVISIESIKREMFWNTVESEVAEAKLRYILKFITFNLSNAKSNVSFNFCFMVCRLSCC